MSDILINEQEQERRREARTRTLQGSKIIIDRNSTFSCQIKDRSDFGFGLKLGNTAGIPDKFTLLDNKNDKRFPVKVVWRKRTMLGVEIVD